MVDRMIAVEKNLNSISNIKDKNNRNAAAQVSKMAIQNLQKFKTQKTQNFKNGIVAFFGLTQDNRQISIVLDDLPSKVNKNIYNLSN